MGGVWCQLSEAGSRANHLAVNGLWQERRTHPGADHAAERG